MEFITSICATIFVIFFTTTTFFLNHFHRRKLPLPPGTLGWPYLGETLHLYSKNPNSFFASKTKKFGSIFKTHVLGCPSVVISSPEEVKKVLVTRAHLFKPTFPTTKMRIMGEQGLFFHQGHYHSKLKKLLLRSFMPDSIRTMVQSIESIALLSLHTWPSQPTLHTFHEMKTYAFNVSMLVIFGKDEKMDREKFKKYYYDMEKGYNSMPINLPGTLFNKSMKARKNLAHSLTEIMTRRRQFKVISTNDLLGTFMENKTNLTDQQISDNIIGLIFAARDTTATVLTWVLKYLSDNPNILRDVADEQEEIRKNKGRKGLTWEDTKKMLITWRVIQETLRVASVLSFTFREAIEDVEFEGYLIPKGWKVLPLFRNIHHSPQNFTNPEMFDPSRFEVAQKPNTFLPFGSGVHSCPGNELAKLEMLVFLHHLITKYRWCVKGTRSGIQYGPFVLPQDGLPITVSSF